MCDRHTTFLPILILKLIQFSCVPLSFFSAYCHNRNSLASLCNYITGDALLYSMFREEALAVACPFRGPMTFTYNRGHGTCSSPQSNVDTCTDDSRLLFKYQACPDVPASESAGDHPYVFNIIIIAILRAWSNRRKEIPSLGVLSFSTKASLRESRVDRSGSGKREAGSGKREAGRH